MFYFICSLSPAPFLFVCFGFFELGYCCVVLAVLLLGLRTAWQSELLLQSSQCWDCRPVLLSPLTCFEDSFLLQCGLIVLYSFYGWNVIIVWRVHFHSLSSPLGDNWLVSLLWPLRIVMRLGLCVGICVFSSSDWEQSYWNCLAGLSFFQSCALNSYYYCYSCRCEIIAWISLQDFVYVTTFWKPL